MRKSELKQIIREELEKTVNEIHSTSNVINSNEFKAALRNLISVFETEYGTYGSNYKKMIRDILVGFGEKMMDLGERLTHDEINFLSKYKKSDSIEMAAE